MTRSQSFIDEQREKPQTMDEHGVRTQTDQRMQLDPRIQHLAEEELQRRQDESELAKAKAEIESLRHQLAAAQIGTRWTKVQVIAGLLTVLSGWIVAAALAYAHFIE